MSATKITLELNRSELLSLTLNTVSNAQEAYADERLNSAAALYHLAAMMWNRLGNDAKACQYAHLRQAVENEMIALAAGDAEEADYIASTIA